MPISSPVGALSPARPAGDRCGRARPMPAPWRWTRARFTAASVPARWEHQGQRDWNLGAEYLQCHFGPAGPATGKGPTRLWFGARPSWLMRHRRAISCASGGGPIRRVTRLASHSTAAPGQDGQDPHHPMTRSWSKAWQMKLLIYVLREYRLVKGSETGPDAAVPLAPYFESMMSLGPYRVPDAVGTWRAFGRMPRSAS
jgi:hypothetical protein